MDENMKSVVLNRINRTATALKNNNMEFHYAESKIAENANSKRKEYSLRNNNCGTFAADVLKQDPSVKDKAPVIIDPRPNSIVKEYQDNFKSLNYDPKKRQVKIE